MATNELRGLRVGALVLVISIACTAGIFVASALIPSPARETRFVAADGHEHREPLHCHGIVVLDGDVAWSTCESGFDQTETSTYLGRFAAADGTWTLLELPGSERGLSGGVAGPSGERVFLIGGQLFEVQGRSIRPLGSTILPLGLARVGNGVELVGRAGAGGVAVSRFERGVRVSQRDVALVVQAAEGHVVEPVSAYFEDARWHILVQDYPRNIAALPVSVTVHEQDETGSQRVFAVVALDDGIVRPLDDGTIYYLPPWLIAGSLGLGNITQRELHVFGPGGLERVRLEGSPYINIIGKTLSVGPHTHPIITSDDERDLRLDGSESRVERVQVRERFDALRVNGQTGPPIAASFHLDGGFRLLPMQDGGYVLLGALGQAYVRVGRDLGRVDALTIPERFALLFVEDRAKRNSDYIDGLGVLRVATVPWMPLGMLVGLAVLLLRRRRPRLAVGIGCAWIAIAAAGAWHFVYVLRYYW